MSLSEKSAMPQKLMLLRLGSSSPTASEQTATNPTRQPGRALPRNGFSRSRASREATRYSIVSPSSIPLTRDLAQSLGAPVGYAALVQMFQPTERELRPGLILALCRASGDTCFSMAQVRAEMDTEAQEFFGAIVNLLAKELTLDEEGEVGLMILAFQKNGTKATGSDECRTHVSNQPASERSRYGSKRPHVPISMIADLLSARESHILKLIADGLSNKEIARNLGIAPETVKSHVKNIFAKLNVENRARAVSRGQALGLVETR